MNFATDMDGTLTNEQIGDYINKGQITDRNVIRKMAASFTPKKGIDILSKMKLSPFVITGRQEYLREVSEKWLRMYNVPFRELIMVPSGYYGKVFDWNKYVKFKIIEHKKRPIQFALEDNSSLVTILNGVGVPTFQVIDDFEKALNSAMESIK